MEDTEKSDIALAKEEWPNSFRTREQLDALLERGVKSNMLEESGSTTFDRVLQRLRDGTMPSLPGTEHLAAELD